MKWRTYKDDIEFIHKFKIDREFNYSVKEQEERYEL